MEGGTGIITKRDSLTIHHTPDEVWSTVERFTEAEPEAARSSFRLPADVRDWKIADAQADIKRDGPDRSKIKRIRYRPFDDRYTYYTGRSRGFLGWPVERLSRNFDVPNIGLITSRLTKGEVFKHVQVTDIMNEVIVMSSVTSNNGFTFPLRIHKGEGSDVENFVPSFRTFLDSRYDHHFTPEEILGYIYAVLHAQGYRSRYAEFLRIDFPRIPFSKEVSTFESLSELGWALIQAHLLRELPYGKLAEYHGKGGHEIEFVRYSPADGGSVAISVGRSFGPVPEAVWNFHIGGYQVLDKYLKSRRGRTLSLDEIEHVGKVADSLAFTIDQMARIDDAYRAAFPGSG